MSEVIIRRYVPGVGEQMRVCPIVHSTAKQIEVKINSHTTIRFWKATGKEVGVRQRDCWAQSRALWIEKDDLEVALKEMESEEA